MNSQQTYLLQSTHVEQASQRVTGKFRKVNPLFRPTCSNISIHTLFHEIHQRNIAKSDTYFSIKEDEAANVVRVDI